MIAPEDFKLDGLERQSDLWRKLERFLVKRLDGARARNDDPKLSADETAAIRGEIAALKALLRLGREPMPLPTNGMLNRPTETRAGSEEHNG